MTQDMQRGIWEQTCPASAEAHQAVLEALGAFEIALIRPSREEQESWRVLLLSKLDALVDCLRQQCRQSEDTGGLIVEMEFIQGRSAYVAEVEDAHNAVLAAAESLRLSLLAEQLPHAAYSNLRRQAAHLAATVRKHQTSEIDLIYESYWRDQVGGD